MYLASQRRIADPPGAHATAANFIEICAVGDDGGAPVSDDQFPFDVRRRHFEADVERDPFLGGGPFHQLSDHLKTIIEYQWIVPQLGKIDIRPVIMNEVGRTDQKQILAIKRHGFDRLRARRIVAKRHVERARAQLLEQLVAQPLADGKLQLPFDVASVEQAGQQHSPGRWRNAEGEFPDQRAAKRPHGRRGLAGNGQHLLSLGQEHLSGFGERHAA